MGDKVAPLLKAFLRPFFDSDDYDIVVNIDLPHALTFISCLSDGPTVIGIEHGIVDPQPLITAGCGSTRRFQAALDDLKSNAGRTSGRQVDLSQFLLAVFATQSRPLILQVFTQVAAIIDSRIDAIATANPIDIAETVQSVAARSRQDRVLLDKLAMGEGMGSSETRVHHPAQHTRSFQMFTQEGKKMRVLDPSSMNENLLTRLEVCVEATFKLIRHINLASDGSRHGCKDANYVIMGGFNGPRYRTHCGVMET
jgi:hypothetical protein